MSNDLDLASILPINMAEIAISGTAAAKIAAMRPSTAPVAAETASPAPTVPATTKKASKPMLPCLRRDGGSPWVLKNHPDDANGTTLLGDDGAPFSTKWSKDNKVHILAALARLELPVGTEIAYHGNEPAVRITEEGPALV